MSILRVNTLQDVAGTGQPTMPGAAKAWVNFNGTGTVAIRSAFNVTSITDGGVGIYTANFSTAMPDATYCAVVSGGESANTIGLATSTGAFSASGIQVFTKNTNTAAADFTNVCVAVFR